MLTAAATVRWAHPRPEPMPFVPWYPARMPEAQSTRRLRSAIAALDAVGPGAPRPSADRMPPTRGNPAPTALQVVRYRDDVRLSVELHGTGGVGGLIRATRRRFVLDHLSEACRGNANGLLRENGLGPVDPYIVVESYLADPLRGQGLGAWLYQEAARLAWLQARAPIAADDCAGYETSESAGRVWDGMASSRVVHARGRVALWLGGDGANPAPLGFLVPDPTTGE